MNSARTQQKLLRARRLLRSQSSNRSGARELPRVLTAAHATSIVVGIVIGSGIFLVPQTMMVAAGSSGIVYLVWLIGGLLSLFGATTCAEIAAARARYGGEYAFLKDAFGDLPAFLFMWTLTLIGKPASLATIAAGLVLVLGNFPRFGALNRPASSVFSWSQLFAVAFTWSITALNIRGTRKPANTQLALTWLKGTMILAIAGFCFFGSRQQGSWQNFSTSITPAHPGLSGIMTALVAALWAYNGWNDVSQMAGEIDSPGKSLPIALIGGVVIVAALYMLTNAAIQYVLPAKAIAGSARPAADAMRLVAGPLGASVVSIGMAVSIVATFIGSSLSGARIPFAAARDGLFFRGIAYVHPRFGTPAAALILQSSLTTLLLMLTRNFQALFSLAIFSQWLAYRLAPSTIFVFRSRSHGDHRPFSAFWYLLSTICFIAAALGLSLFSLVSQPRSSSFAIAAILSGIPAYRLYQRYRTAS